MQNLITAHCELTIKHDEKQQKNVGPVVVTFGAIFTAESVNELFCAICQDGIRFKAIYNPDNMYFLRHELSPIADLSVKTDQDGNIIVSVIASTSPYFEIKVLKNGFTNSDTLNSSAIRTLVRNHQSTFQEQISDYFETDQIFKTMQAIFAHTYLSR